mgnify:CR=1 FL=1
MNSINPDLDPALDAIDMDALEARMQEKADALSEDEPATLGIPAGVDGLVHEAPGVLRAISKTVGADGTRHQHLLTYRWAQVPTGLRYVVLSCNCPCCWGRDVPSCRHALLADTVRVGLVAVAERLQPDTVVKGAPVTDSVVILMMRPLLVDLLMAADFPAEKARALLPEV